MATKLRIASNSASPAAKAIRAGLIAGLPRSPHTAYAQAGATALAAALDAIRNDPDATPRERRETAQRALAEFERSLKVGSDLASGSMQAANAAAQRIRDAVANAERSLSLIELERIRSRAAGLRELPTVDRGEAIAALIARGVDRGDMPSLMVASVLSPDDSAIQRAIAVTAAKDHVAAFLDTAPAALAATAALEAARAGLAELRALEAPWERPGNVAGLMLDAANGSGLAAVGATVTTPPEWGTTLGDLAVAHVARASAEPAAPAQDGAA